jgi:hypothetical protein
MLTGIAQEVYYNRNLITRVYFDACNDIRNYFKTLATQNAQIVKWNSIILRFISAKNPGKTPTEAL